MDDTDFTCPLGSLVIIFARMNGLFKVVLPIAPFFFFFFNEPAPPEISPLPLHAAFPIPRNPAGGILAGLIRSRRRIADARTGYPVTACTDHRQYVALRLSGLRRRADTAANLATVRGIH